MPDVPPTDNEPISDQPFSAADSPSVAAQPSESSSPAPVVSPDSVTTAQPTSMQPSSKPRRTRNLIFALVVLLAAGGGAGYWVHQHRQSAAVTTKRDIPVINYGIPNSGVVPQYPVNIPGSSLSVEINAQLFEGLVGYQNRVKLVPLLAVSWSNPTDSTWVFNLRQGVPFHSGRTMTAEDVKYSLDYAVAHQTDDHGGSVLSAASTIKQVEVVNKYQVKITTDGPDPVLLNKLSYLGIIDSKATLGDYNAGTGSYMVKAGTKPTDTTIDLAASNNYWGGHVYTREVKIKLYDSLDTLATDTNSGKVDLAGDFNASQLSKIKRYQPISVPDEGTNFVVLNTEKAASPLKSVSARQAIGYALNVPAILKAAGLKGEQASQLVPLLLAGHNNSVSNTPYNPTKAKQLLVSSPNAATPLSFGYLNLDTPQADEITKQLEAAGFTVQKQPTTDFDALLSNGNAGQYDLYYYGYSSSNQDGSDILSGVLQGNKDYNNPQIDSLLTQAGSTLDQFSRIKDMQKVATIVNTDKPVIPLFTIDRQFALTKHYVVKPDMPGMVTGTYFWKVYQN